MKRRLLLAAIFLLAGAVVNVAVAWGCVAWVRNKVPVHPAPSKAFVQHLTRIPPDRFGDEWIALDAAFGFGGIGTYRELRGATTTRERERAAREGFEPQHFLLSAWTVRSGLPMASLEGLRADSSSGLWLHGGLLTPHWMRVDRGFLPLIPVWPGFIVNTLLYAVALWLLIPGPFVLRRFIRVKRGLCPACAYPMGESATCSECGNMLPARVTT